MNFIILFICVFIMKCYKTLDDLKADIKQFKENFRK